MPHPAQLLSDPRRPYVPQSTTADPAPPKFTDMTASIPPLPSSFSPSALSASSAPSASPTAPQTLIPFDPPEERIDKLILAFADPTRTLVMIAREQNIGMSTLTAWMARPDIRQRIDNFNNSCATCTRSAANASMTMVVQTCQAVIHEFHNDQDHMGYKPQTPQGHEVKRRNRQTALGAGRMLMRLAKYVPVPSTPGTPTLRGGSSDISHESPAHNNPATPKSRSRKSTTPTLESQIAAALLDNPHLATQLAQAIKARLDKANSPSPDPHSEIPNPQSEIAPTTPASSSSEISNLKSEIPPAAPSAIPSHPRAPRPSAANSPATPVNLTISARPRAP